MGEAKPRIIMAASSGAASGHAETERVTIDVVNELLPQLEAIAERYVDWSPVLNALCTLTVNLHIEIAGPSLTENVLRQMLRAVPESAAAMRHYTADGRAIPPAGRA